LFIIEYIEIYLLKQSSD